MSNSSQKVFQLTSISQNDPQTEFGAELYAIVEAFGSELQQGSSPTEEKVKLPIPPVPGKTPPPSPTWFLAPLTEGTLDNRYFLITVVGPKGYPPLKNYKIKATDVAKWGDIPFGDRPNQLIREGALGIFGFAQNPTDANLIYTVTAGVYFPQEHPS